MKVWVFVEGESDSRALSSLWNDWKQELQKKRWGIQLIPLKNKSNYFKKIGPRTAEKLLYNENDLVVGLPDLYPNQNYASGEYRHSNMKELREIQVRLVNRSLQKNVSPDDINRYMDRFYGSALKHDLEMLLLTVPSLLQKRLGVTNISRSWRVHPEDQNQNKPPKKIVEALFQTRLKRAYREMTDCEAILGKAALSEVLFDESGIAQCPTFRAMLDWIGEKTGVQAYNIGNAG